MYQDLLWWQAYIHQSWMIHCRYLYHTTDCAEWTAPLAAVGRGEEGMAEWGSNFLFFIFYFITLMRPSMTIENQGVSL